MNVAIGELLPFAIGIAISPLPIIAAILMLLSPRAKKVSLGFLAGWMLGIIATLIIFTLLASAIPVNDSDDPQPIIGIVKVVLGMLMLVLAIQQWKSRPVNNTDATMPKWMTSIETMTPIRALSLGLLLSALNPKNLFMEIGAGVVLSTAGITVAMSMLVGAIFVLFASSTIVVPVVGYFTATKKMSAPLGNLRTWLLHNNATVMSVLLLVLGVVNVGKGIASF